MTEGKSAMARNSLRNLVASCLLLGGLLGCAGAPDTLPSNGPQSQLLQPDPVLVCRAERGMGGTGIVAQAGGSDRGMGGTGVIALDRGMGGTGIIGTVTGFGSICVNGFRVAYDGTTPVSVNDLLASADILERGMTVAVTATVQGGQLQAGAIEILHALVGPVTATANADNVLSVMGVSIEAAHAAGTPAASLSVGDVVAIDGLQKLNGVVDATHIMSMPKDAKASVRGVVQRGNDLAIASVPIATPAATLTAGSWAAVSGVWANGVLQAEKVTAGIEVSNVARLSVEGYLVAGPNAGLSIRGVAVGEDVSRGLDRVALARLAAGQRVQIIGQRQTDGSLRPEIVIVPNRPSPLDTDVTAATTPTTATRTTTESEDLQPQRGVYGTTVTRTQTVREVAPVERPAALTTRPAVQRPEVRPVVRPDVRPDIQRPPTVQRPGR